LKSEEFGRGETEYAEQEFVKEMQKLEQMANGSSNFSKITL